MLGEFGNSGGEHELRSAVWKRGSWATLKPRNDNQNKR